MREVAPDSGTPASEAATFAACIATILELEYGEVPPPDPGEELPGWRTMRWLGGLGVGLVPVGDAATFQWAGPWIGLVDAGDGERRAVVMYGVPSGVVWDPGEGATSDEPELVGGFVLAALDVAEARPALPESPDTEGAVTAIFVAPAAGAPAEAAGRGSSASGQRARG